jgi:hypothetical protein
MRHANIKTTLDYYVNIDDAVEAAIFGSQRNISRNIDPENVPSSSGSIAAKSVAGND